ncbi:MAG: T9SS C-terminal target domain-containing protein [Bacteroidetes bacterium]|nr:MAG: T9SS C-terminal target domain-containing protein [Bacteroidota bacterium]
MLAIMKRNLATAFFFLVSIGVNAQLLSWSPQFPTDASTITITLDANLGNRGLLGYDANDVYVHTGTITSASTGANDWKYVKFGSTANLFNTPLADLKATPVPGMPNRWTFTIANPRSYYGVPGAESISRISILFRNGNGTRVQRNADGSDMYIPLATGALQARITNPFKQPTFIPRAEVITATIGQSLPIAAAASTSAALELFFNGSSIAVANSTTISASPLLSQPGNQRIIAVANGTARDTVDFFLPAATVSEALPAGLKDGPNYSPDNTSATLVLYAPNKSNVVVVGDFNNWMPSTAYQMKRTPDGLRYWLTLPAALVPGTEYAYQFLIDGTLQVSDYMTQKILDGWNDRFINTLDYPNRYPNLKAYPANLPNGMVSVLQPGKPTYTWSSATTNFQRPDKRNLIQYEIHLRDFLARNDWKTLIDSLNYLANLGINSLSVMPFTEFEGNNSWGYNPAYMFAADKFYGPENDLKRFIDSCHGRGISVVLDMVLNHQFGQSPLAQMYWNSALNQPAANNPWLNPVPKHGFNVGYDMNHEAPATIKFVEDVMRHWLEEFRIDGFRWDLSKGFTQRQTCDNNGANCNVGSWNAFDQSRVNIWNRIYNQSQAISPNCYMILEHLGDDDEENALARMGMMFWGKMTDQFNQMTMGFADNSDISRSYATTRWSSFGANPPHHLMAYAESHDEERLMFKNTQFGSTANGNHNTRSTSVRLRRAQMVPAFLFTIPGPKMMWQFGELGYEQSINRCEDGSINTDCRTSPKPVLWEYRTQTNRVNLMNMYARMARLRTQLPQFSSTFTTYDLSFGLTGNFKWQSIRSAALNVMVIGNINVFAETGTVTFPSTGTWHNYANNIALIPGDPDNNPFNNVNNGLSSTQFVVNPGAQTQSFTLQPGEFVVFTSQDANTILPLRLVSFSGFRQPNAIALQWQSQNEHNSDRFEVERAFDGKSFTTISKVAARNTAGPAQNTYRLNDADAAALSATAAVSYRLKIYDKDGSFTYSKLVVVAPLGASSQLTVLPNPVQAHSKVSFETNGRAWVSVQILSSTGQQLATIFNGQKERGVHTLPLQTAQFNVATLANGLYYVQLVSQGKVETQKLIVAK